MKKQNKTTTAKALFHLAVAAVTPRHQRAATAGRWIFPATTHAGFFWTGNDTKKF